MYSHSLSVDGANRRRLSVCAEMLLQQMEMEIFLGGNADGKMRCFLFEMHLIGAQYAATALAVVIIRAGILSHVAAAAPIISDRTDLVYGK